MQKFCMPMDIFTALADSTRRNIIEMLASNGQLSATEIYDKFQVSPQAISQHLKVLREANLVRVEKRAQQRIYQMNPDAMAEVEEWAKQYRQIWSRSFEELDKVLKVQIELTLKNKMEGNEETHGKKQ
jgi:DNA-binding transcriptional ArsR family regulator